jgi:hypothetical protein
MVNMSLCTLIEPFEPLWCNDKNAIYKWFRLAPELSNYTVLWRHNFLCVCACVRSRYPCEVARRTRDNMFMPDNRAISPSISALSCPGCLVEIFDDIWRYVRIL